MQSNSTPTPSFSDVEESALSIKMEAYKTTLHHEDMRVEFEYKLGTKKNFLKNKRRILRERIKNSAVHLKAKHIGVKILPEGLSIFIQIKCNNPLEVAWPFVRHLLTIKNINHYRDDQEITTAFDRSSLSPEDLKFLDEKAKAYAMTPHHNEMKMEFKYKPEDKKNSSLRAGS